MNSSTNRPPSKPMTEIFWAKLPGFSPWPARKCSIYEENMLRDLQPPKVSDTVPVVFLGLKKERAWIVKTNIFPLTVETWSSKIDKRKFKTDRDYRAAIFEGVRIKTLDISELQLNNDGKEIPSPTELCDVCHGSEHSGSTISCGICLAKGVHWHCFLPEDPDALNKIWICDECCVANHFAIGTTLTAENSPAELPAANENSVEAKADRGSRHSNGKSANENSSHRRSTGSKSAVHKDNSGDKDGNTIPSKPSAVVAKSKNAISSEMTVDNPDPDLSAEIPDPGGPTKLEVEDVDDNCFICGESGEVLLCDYPLCRKVYHQVCVLKIFPCPNAFDLAHQQLAHNNEWWCPRHYCLDCGAVEKLSVPIHSIPLPQVVYDEAAQQRRSGNRQSASELITQRLMQACEKCPFTLCDDCDRSCTKQAASLLPIEFLAQNSLFQQSPLTGLHAVGGTGKPMPRALSSLLGSTSPDLQSSIGVMRNDIEWGLCCKFCVFAQSLNGESHVLDAQLNSLGMLGHSSTVPHHSRREGQQRSIVALGKRVPSTFRQRWQLARLLERTWVKMANTRLALPFLRPLLPISLPHSGMLSTTAEDQQNETDDLVTLLEEIHALRFDSTDAFVHAIERLRQCVANRLSQTPGSPKQRDLLQMAFHTIAVAGSGFLHRREARLWSERALLKTREDEALTASSSTETSNGTASSAVLAARKRRSGAPSSSNVADASKSMDALTSSLAGQEAVTDTVDTSFAMGYTGNPSISYLLYLLPLTSRLACHIQPLNRPGTFSAVLAALHQSLENQKDDDDDVYDVGVEQHLSQVFFPSTAQSSPPLATPRSLAAWADHVAIGDARLAFYDKSSPEQNNGDIDDGEGDAAPGSADHVIGSSSARALRPKNYLDMPAIAAAKRSVKRLLECEEEDDFAAKIPRHSRDFPDLQHMLDHDYDVAESMMSMRQSAARESVSLLYPHECLDGVIDATWKPSHGNCGMDIGQASALHPSRQALLQRSIVEAPLDDDSELMLRRMQETTQHLLALQARFQLMHDVQRQQRLVGTTSQDVVSLGEVGVVQELKLANDNLRWKIQQRDALLVNAYQQIAALQQRLAEQET